MKNLVLVPMILLMALNAFAQTLESTNDDSLSLFLGAARDGGREGRGGGDGGAAIFARLKQLAKITLVKKISTLKRMKPKKF